MTITIVAAGLVSPLGTGLARVSAAWRGGVSGLHEHPWALTLQGRPPIVGAALPVSAWPDRHRFAALVTAAVGDSLPQVARSVLQRTLHLLIALPSARPGLPAALEQDVVDAITMCLRGVARVSRVQVLPQDECGGISALALAAEYLGADEVCLIVGVDSWLDPDAFEWLDRNRQLHGGGHHRPSLWGAIPAEAAAALWVTRREGVVLERSVTGLHVEGTGLATEPSLPGTDAVITGRSLHRAIENSAACIDNDNAPVGVIVTDFGASQWRAEEWALASMRVRGALAQDLPLLTPADRWGDIGAASGVALLALTSSLLQQRSLRGNRALVVTMAASGARAAATVSSAQADKSASATPAGAPTPFRSAA
jgi:3-oxoacyl-[acyl-carrier-protein] synthase I